MILLGIFIAFKILIGDWLQLAAMFFFKEYNILYALHNNGI